MNDSGNFLVNLGRVENEQSFEVQIWDIQSKVQKCAIKGGKWSVLNPIGNEVVVSEEDGKFIWDITTCKVEKEIQISTDSGLSTYHPGGNILGTASQGISFLDLSNNSILNKIENFPNSPNWPRIISFNPDGSLFAAVISSKTDQEPDTVAIWKIEYEDN